MSLILTSTPAIALAPIDGFTDLPFRRLCREMGATLVFTEMTSANGLVNTKTYRAIRLNTCDEEQPCFLQLSGSNPATIAEAARLGEQAGFKGIDINAGCPSKKVMAGGGGARLLFDLGRLEEVVKAVQDSVSVPVSLKVRAGLSADALVLEQIADIATRHRLAFVTLHARTVAQGFAGSANWEWIGHLKRNLGVKVIGNGDVKEPQDALRMLEQTGCDGVMIGRAALGNPWIFRDVIDLLKGRMLRPRVTREERARMILRHFDLLLEHTKSENIASNHIRKHLMRYVRGMPGASQIRGLLPRISSKDDLNRMIQLIIDPTLFSNDFCDEDYEKGLA
jgi:nifR3 family TIM-barrel protein